MLQDLHTDAMYSSSCTSAPLHAGLSLLVLCHSEPPEDPREAITARQSKWLPLYINLSRFQACHCARFRHAPIPASIRVPCMKEDLAPPQDHAQHRLCEPQHKTAQGCDDCVDIQ